MELFPDLRDLPESDPISIYRYRDGLYAADLLSAAIVWLDFFSWLAVHPSTKEAICAERGLVDRPVDVMLTLFAAMGLIESEQGVFHLTTLAKEHLVAGSPWFLGPYYGSLKERPVCKDMLSVLQTGRTANWGSLKTEKDWAKAMEDSVFAGQFTAAMDCRGVYLGQAVAKNVELKSFSRLLDIAGGSGIYACSMVAHHPHLRASVFEKTPVDKVAAEAIAKRGFNDRVSVIAGNMFANPLPTGFDIHLISNVLHDWDITLVMQILKSSFDALMPGGLLIIHDAHINREKTGPLPVAAYSAMLMHSTEGKCYSIAETESYLTNCGFHNFDFKDTAADRGIITARKPK
ncbi:MAG: dnrK [Verrucomicrobiales bacterium]|nr:dnrK [Verrucomicrobiales bacterium]